MMKLDKVESLGSLISAMEDKRAKTEERRGRLKAEMDKLVDEANALESQAKAKRRDAKDLYEEIGSLDYGDWLRDVLRPLADELARRAGKSAQLHGPAGLGSRVTVALVDDPEIRCTEQDALELTVEPDFFSGKHMTLSYETGERSDRYKPDTVGFFNGLNNITATLPDSIEEILALFRMRPAVNLSGKEEETDGSEG